MRILIISQYYSPEGASIPTTLARNLAARGHEVKTLTGYPNYPEGRIFDGYRQRWRMRERDGRVDVLRVPLWIDRSPSAPRRTLSYVSFGVSASTAAGFARDADVIYVYASQMTPALAPWLWRAVGGAPYVLHVQDLWPDSITGASFVNGTAGRAVESLLNPWIRSVYKHAAAVIGIAPTMVKTLIGRGVDEGKAHLVFNWTDERAASGGEAVPPGADETNVLYGGNIGDMQDLENAVVAAHRARDTGVRLTILGDGVALPRVRAAAQELGATNVSFEGRVSRAEMGRFLTAADYSLVSLKDLQVFRGTIPSKFQTALSHGTPVISTVQGDVRELVEEHGLGFTADAEDPRSLESAFRQAAGCRGRDWEALSSRARSAYQDHFSLEAGVAAVEDILAKAARSNSRHGLRVDTKERVSAVR